MKNRWSQEIPQSSSTQRTETARKNRWAEEEAAKKSAVSLPVQTPVNRTPVQNTQPSWIDMAVDSAREQAEENRRRQNAIDYANDLDIASSKYDGPTRKERYTTTLKLNDTDDAQEYTFTRDVKNERYNPLSRNDRDALIDSYVNAVKSNDYDAAQQAYLKAAEYGGFEQLYAERNADAANDREYSRLINGNDVSDMTRLDRFLGSWGNFGASVGENIAESALGLYASNMNTAALNAANEDSPASYRNALDKLATTWYYGLVNGADDPGVEDNVRKVAAYVGGDAYADAVIKRIRERADEDIRSGGEMGFSSDMLDDIKADDNALWKNLQETVSESGVYDAMAYLQDESQRSLQRAKDINNLQDTFIGSKVMDSVIEGGVSTAQNMIDAGLAAMLGLSGTGVVAMIPFALRAYGGSYAEQINQARSLGQMISQDIAKNAASNATYSAAIEVGTEMMWGMVGSMSKVTGGGALDDYAQEKLANALSGWIKSEQGAKIIQRIGEKALGGFTEGLEEVIGDAATRLLTEMGLMTGDVGEYSEWVKEVGHSFVIGALGGLMGEVSNIVATPMQQAQTGKQLRSGGITLSDGTTLTVDDMVNLANSEGMEGTTLEKTYSELFKGVPRSTNSFTDQELGKLYSAYEETMGKSDEAIERVETIAEKLGQGEELTRADVNRITNNREAVRYLKTVAGEDVDLSGNITERKAAVNNALQALASQDRALYDYDQAIAGLGDQDANAAELQRQKRETAYGFDNERELLRQTLPAGVADNYFDESKRQEAYYAAQRLGISEDKLNEFANAYAGTRQNAENAAKAYKLGAEGGDYDISLGIENKETYKSSRDEFLKASAKEEISNDRAEAEGIRLRAGGERNDGTSASGSSQSLERGTGKTEAGQSGVVVGKSGLKRIRRESLNRESLRELGLRDDTDSNRADIKEAREDAESRGLNFVAFSGGNLHFEGERYGVRGYFDGKTIYVRTDHALITARQIEKHEAMHADIQGNKVKIGTARGDSKEVEFGTVRDALIKSMGIKAFERLLDSYVVAYEGTGLSDQEIWEELVCDAAGGMNEQFYQGHQQEAMLLAPYMEKVKEATEELAANGERAGPAESTGKMSVEKNDVTPGAYMPRTASEMRSRYTGDDAMYAIDQNGRKFSIDSMERDIIDKKFQSDLVNKLGWKPERVNALVASLNDLMEYMKPDRDILDMNESYTKDNRPYSPYKPNSDPLYKISLDYSTLCRKRLMTQYIIEKLQLREHRPMSGEEQIAIRDMLKEYREIEHGLQVACAMCYVEAARLKSPDQMNRWLEDSEPILKNFFAQKNKAYKRKVENLQKKWKTDHGYSADATKKQMSPADVTAFNEYSSNIRKEYNPNTDQADAKRRSEELAAIERAKGLSPDNFLSAENLAKLKESDPLVYTAYTSHIRAATRSKGLETDVPYYYGDSRRKGGPSDKFIQNVNAENGMRFSSWSDFQFIHLLDQMMATIDLSVRKAAMHGYTKFPEQVRIFGKTGAMFNMSGVSGGTGFNADGSLYFSPTESIDFEEAKRLREEFPDTAGLQCIGINEKHTRALLQSDFIDYVIPYHVSGLNATLRKMAGISGWKDYTSVQEESPIDSKEKWDPSKKCKEKEWHKTPVFSEFFDKKMYTDSAWKGRGVEAMRAAAQKYIEMCHDRGLHPKFEEYTNEANYWKLLIDRKMVNQKTGDLIQQRPVTPDFDFDVIKKEIKTYVENYRQSQGIEERALKYITDNWDQVPGRIETLKKEGTVEKNIAEAEKNEAAMREIEKKAFTLGNEMYAAAPKNVAAYKYSRDLDSDYMSAIKSGDMETAQKLVDEAAKNAGYVLSAYHGTGEYFNTFRMGFEGIHLGNKEQASQVAKSRYENRSSETNYKWSDLRKNLPEVGTEQRIQLKSQFEFAPMMYEIEDFTGDINNDADVIAYGDKIDSITDYDPTYNLTTYDRKVGKHLMRLYAKIQNPFVINGDIADWTPYNIASVLLERADGIETRRRWSSDTEYSIGGSPFTLNAKTSDLLQKIANYKIKQDDQWDALAQVFEQMGYDGIQYLNEYEGDKNSYSYIALHPSDVKSADPITYDEDGNVIPLSKRFNPKNDDIRYSRDFDSAGNHLTEQQAEYFKDSKVRDKNGKLLVMYHGTDADFTVFDFKRGGEHGKAEGFGIYLADNKSVSEHYGGRIIKSYANITRPAKSDAKTIRASELAKLIKASCLAEANKMAEEYDGKVSDALRDTWVSNYEYTYDKSMDAVYREVANNILRMNDNDMDIVQEVMAGMSIRTYDAAMEFYNNILTPTTGIDGFVTQWSEQGSDKKHLIALAFNSNQIKNTDNQTPTENPDIRFSRDLDSDYMSAIKSGDMETAQKLVDEAAKAAGFSTKVYHGTDAEKINVFSGNSSVREENGTSKIRGYFSDQEEYSKDYGRYVRAYYLKDDANYLEIPTVDSADEMTEYLAENGVTGVRFNDFITNEEDVDSWMEDYGELNPWLFFNEAGGNITERIAAAGYDGLWWSEGLFNEDGGAAYMPFNSSDVKSADPVTYDDNGNVIPLSERFNPKNDDIRYSRDLDSDYMSAVQSGNTAAQERLVKEAAERAGYTVEGYHGTQQFGFTKIDLSKLDDNMSFFVTNDMGTARTYSTKEAVTNINRSVSIDEMEAEIEEKNKTAYNEAISFGTLLSYMAGIQGWSDIGILQGSLDDIVNKYAESGNEETFKEELWTLLDQETWALFDYMHGQSSDNEDVYYRDDVDDYDEWMESDETERLRKELDEIANAYTDWFYALMRYHNDEYSGNYHVYINPSNLFMLDCKGRQWNSLEGDGKILKETNGGRYWNTRSIAKWAKENGYEGVLFHDVVDDGGRGTVRVKTPADVYALFNPQAQVKSADPVTYDADGNVIPLSERFNPKNDDIRFSRELKSEEKRRAGEKLTESQFYSLYSAHKVDMRRQGNAAEQIQKIREEGFKGTGGFMGNTLPTRMTYKTVDGKKVPDNVVVGRYAPRKGEYILLIPRSGLDSQYNVKIGYKPEFDYEIVQADYDYQPYYEMYSKAYDAAKAKFSRDLTNYDLVNENRELQKAVTELRSKLKTKTEQYKYWKGQTKVTEGRQLRTEDVTRLAREIIKGQESSADAKAVAEKMKALGEYILNTDDENVYDESRMKAYEIAHDILTNAKVLNERGGEHFYTDFRKALLQTPIYVTPSVREEVSPDGWNGLRQMAKGVFTPTSDKSKGKSVDVIYHDLQSTFGEWLLPEYIANEADQLNKIFEVVETYQPIYENLNSYEMADAVEWTANEILTRIIGNEIRETNPTYADRMEKKLADQKMKSQEALRKVRENRDKKVANLKEHYQQVAEDRRNRKIDSEMRSRLLAIAKRLHNKKLPRAQRALLDQYIGEIDLVAKSITGRTIENLEQLKTWYEEYKENKGDDFIPDKFIERKLDRLSKKHISEMTQEEVADLTTVLLNFENKIRTQNKLLESKIKADVYAAGLQTIDDINNSHGNKGFLSKAIGAETATPERYIHRITGYRENSPLYQAAKELSDGQRKMLDYQRRAEALFEKWTNDKKFIRSIAGKNADSIKVTGYFDGELFDAYITPAMRMALYLHEKNDDNMRHISKGGVKIPNMTLYRKGKMQEAYDDAIRLVFTRGQIKEITSHMTDKERAFADAISRYYNGMSRDEINAASEILKGYGIAGVDWYYPIDTDGSFLRKDFDSVKRDGSIEGMGFTKERIDNASNPIMLYDINDTLNKSISQHSKYVGLAIPVRNFNKLYTTTSFKSKMAENAYDSTWTYDTSVAEALKENWGSTATKYIEKMMSDIQNGTGLKQDYWGDLMAKARSKYAGAVLNTNLSVAMKQAASYPTAAAVVGYGPLVKALGDVKKADLVKLAQYTPLLWQRMRGYGILEVGDIRNEGKQIPKALNWIQTMDVATTTKLVKAAMIYVNENQKDLTRNSDAWWKAVAEVYNRIIEETQPNYTMMQRPQILRSENALTRALNMFKTQPFQNFNILYDAFGNLAAKTREVKANPTQENRDALKQARVTAARAVSSQAVSAFVFALMQFAWDAFRGKAKKYKDDDDEMTFASWLKGMGINVLSSVGGMVPFGSYALELGETMTDAILKAFKLDPFFDQTFYGLSENASESVNDMGKALINLVTKISQSLSGGEITESTVRSVVDSMGDIAQFVGIPANNAMNLAKAIARNAFLTTEGKYVGGYHALRVTTDPAKYPGDYYNLLWKAYNNDTAAYNELLQKMLDDGFEESKIKTAMEKRMKESQGVSSVNDLESRFMSPDQQKIYDKELAGIEQTTMFQAATDEQQQALMKKLYNLATDSSAGQKMNEKIVGGASVGLDQTEYLLYTLALSMVDKPNSSGNYGSYTNEEVEAAILMVPGLSNAERAYLWEAAGKTQKTNPWR